MAKVIAASWKAGILPVATVSTASGAPLVAGLNEMTSSIDRANTEFLHVINGLSETTFLAQVQPILQAQCAGCHQAGLGNPRNRFVLTGSAEGDFNVTLSMINNTCTPASNALLQRPSTVPHPSGDLTQLTALLPVGSSGYNQISAWIQLGCPTR